jgi:hypothetical protein
MKESPSRFQLHWIHPSNNNPLSIRQFNRATNFVINSSVGMLDNDGLNMIIFVIKLFDVFFDSIKINFHFVKDCFSGKIFVSLKG